MAAAVLSTAAACGGSPAAEWHLPNADLASTRSLASSGIERGNVTTLRLAWRFRISTPPGESGAMTATPVVDGGAVFVQDMRSNVVALDLETGAVRWRHRFGAPNPGPNGVAVAGGRVFGATDTTVFALDEDTGQPLWATRLVNPQERFVDIPAQTDGRLVYSSTIGLPPNGRGALYALDAGTGRIRWRRSTIRDPWPIPAEAGGGGAWYPPSVDGGETYWGTANPYPYGGTRRHPNGGAYRGPALYTDSILAVDGHSGKVDWYDQVTPHDVRDHDFQLPPILATIGGKRLVIGSGKGGVVVAWDRATHRRVWQRRVGLHRNDSGPLPRQRVPVCPGLLGGVETPMAFEDGRLFVPVVDLCTRGSAVGYEPLERVKPERGRGSLLALDAGTGRQLWRRRLSTPIFGCATAASGMVFTATFDGRIYAFDARSGATLLELQASAGINACPALARHTLLVAAGIPRGGTSAVVEAYRPAGQ